MGKTISIIAVLFFIGCTELPNEVKSEVGIGLVLSASYKSRTFSSNAKTILETEKGFFVLRGLQNVVKGDRATLRTMTNGFQYVCFESLDMCKRAD